MKRSYLSLAIACVLAVPFAAIAATEADADTQTPEATDTRSEPVSLSSVTVTARRREETIQDVPIAVTAFTPETLDRLNVQDLSDLSAQVPNMTLYAARGSSSTITAYIRGIGQSDPLWGVDPGVGIYMDDVYIARPQGALLDVFDVSRVEVLRGPQGTLYGKNTIGGAIKYISNPLPVETEGFASLTIGEHNQVDVKAAIGGSLGGSDGALRGRISLASLNRDGYGNNILTGEEVSDKEILAARGQLGAFVTDDFDIQFAFDWMDDQSGVRGAKLLAPNTHAVVGLLFPDAASYLPMDSRYDVRNSMPNINDTSMKGISATANWRANDDWVFKYIVAKRESDTETNIDFDALPFPIADVKAFYNDTQVSHELQAHYDAGGAGRGVVGLYYFDGEAGGQVLNNFFGIQFGDTQGTVYTESLSLYGDWTFDLSTRLSLNLGARWTDEDKRADVYNVFFTDDTFTTPTGEIAAEFDKSVSFSNVSPKVSLDYQITPDVLLYGVASRGFKSGGYNIRANNAVPHTLLPFDDEKVDSFEVGLKAGLLDQRLFLNFALFHNAYDDIQLSVFTELPGGGFLGDFTNAGEGTVNGVEVEYQWAIADNWRLNGNLAWLDAKYDEFISGGTNIADTQDFTNSPEFSGAVNLEYFTDLAHGGNLSARLGYSYQSGVWPTTDLHPDIYQPGYGLVSAGVIWKTPGPWSFSLQGSNLTDKEYRTTGYNLVAALGTLTGFYGAPRQVSLTARYDF